MQKPHLQRDNKVTRESKGMGDLETCPQQGLRVWTRQRRLLLSSVASAVPCAMHTHDCRQLAPWLVPIRGLTKGKVR